MPEQKRPPRSLRRQLLLLVLGAVASIWIATAIVSYVDARHELDELLDAHLAQSASLLIAQAGHDPEEIDERIALNREVADREEQLWAAQQTLLQKREP